jgi:hypothetical protein
MNINTFPDFPRTRQRNDDVGSDHVHEHYHHFINNYSTIIAAQESTSGLLGRASDIFIWNTVKSTCLSQFQWLSNLYVSEGLTFSNDVSSTDASRALTQVFTRRL